ncbi:MAG: T9SS type A sorting domain-containing protein [Bacteroidota bacterium]
MFRFFRRSALFACMAVLFAGTVLGQAPSVSSTGPLEVELITSSSTPFTKLEFTLPCNCDAANPEDMVADFKNMIYADPTHVDLTWTVHAANDSIDFVLVKTNGIPSHGPGTIARLSGHGVSILIIDVLKQQMAVEETVALAVSVFPSPSNGKFSVAGNFQAGSVIAVADLQGRVIEQRNVRGASVQQDFYLNVKPGMYIVRISGESYGTPVTKRLPIQ